MVFYDSLVDTRVLDLAKNFAKPEWSPELLFVGKRRNKASLKQEEINQLIVQFLDSGKNVSRLKGGDPFVFARGVEEIAFVNHRGYEAHVIPGLTSGLALPALAGVALSLRNCSDSIILSTGHEVSPSKLQLWAGQLQSGSTLVIYMGLFHTVDICRELRNLNTLSQIKAIAISNGSLDNEKIIYSTLSDLPQDIINAEIASPCILVLGKHIKQNLKIRRTPSIENKIHSFLNSAD